MDGNLAALREYERRVDFADSMESSFRNDIRIYIEDMISAMQSIEGWIKHYEYDYGLDFRDTAIEDIKEELGL